jgi:hypothetical protein
MGFLSISSVDAGGNKVPNRSAAQIASYISTITSFGSLIMSLLLLRQVKHRSTAVDAVRVSLSIPSLPLTESTDL